MNQQLVKGAAQVAASKRSTWNQAFQENLNASLAAGAKRSMQRKAEKARANAKTASYINSLNSNVDTTSLTASQQSAVSNYLTEQKMTYANAARRIAKLEPTHPAYMRLRDEMNGVQMNFTNLAGSLNQYKKDKIDYLKDFDNSMLSAGNETGSFVEASKIYTDEGSIGIGQGGSLNFYDEEKGEYKKYNEITKPFLKDTGAGNSILQMNEQVYKSGKELTGARRNMVRQKLNNMIGSGGRDTLLSLASDDFVIEGGLGLQDPSLFEKENEALLKQAVLDGYMSVLEDSAAQGAIDNRPKVSGGSGADGRKTLQEEIPVVNDAFEFGNVYSTNVPPNQREDKTLLLVQELNAIDPTKKGNYISRGTLYDMYLQNFKGGDNYELDDNEESRSDFVNKYGNSQVYLFNEKDPISTSPILVNTDSPRELYEFYLKNSNLTSKAQNYHIGQYGSYIANSEKPKENNTTDNNETNTEGSSTENTNNFG
jgi:hypothetical protein